MSPLRLLAFCVGLGLMAIAHAAEYDVDPTFAPTQTPPGWRRLFIPGGGQQDENAVAFARTADGGYVVCLSVPGGAQGARIGLIRLAANGERVSSGFGTNGVVVKDAFLGSVTDMTIDAQGRIIVVGSTPGPGGARDFGVVRFNPDGTDDTSFAGDGGTATGFDNPFANFDDAPVSVLAQADGKIVVAGDSKAILAEALSEAAVVRFNADGSLDHGFGSVDDGAGGRRGTLVSFIDGKDATATKILRVIGDNFVVVGGTAWSTTDRDFAARLLLPSGEQWSGDTGSIVMSFDIAEPGGTLFDDAKDAALADSSTIVIAGGASNAAAAVRLRVNPPNDAGYYTDLSIDLSFLGNGVSSFSNRFVTAEPDDHYAFGVVVDPDRRTVIVGHLDSGPVRNGLVMRLKVDGTQDYSLAGAAYARDYAAPASTGDSAYTRFTRVLFDGAQPVLLGSSVDSTTSATTDFDGVITRFSSSTDTIFANGFESTP